MNCSHFGKCGSCSSWSKPYEVLLKEKEEFITNLLQPFYKKDIDLFKSPKSHHRARAEFKIWHIQEECYYAMTNSTKDGVEIINECPKVVDAISSVQYALLGAINKSDTLKEKLFAIEFLGSKSKELLVTLIYHKKLDENWIWMAKELESAFAIKIIGRSRKQKIALSQEYIIESLNIKDKTYHYKYYEGGFTQPNPYVNEKMIEWAMDRVSKDSGDLLELYCGLGNFTLPLSQHFKRVLATEISKNSIKAAKENCVLNNITNIKFIRLNAAETAQALRREREFRRLREVDLDEYNFTTVFVDPPRAGLDEESIKLVQNFDTILYISCNPQTLYRDLEALTHTHTVVRAAMFDQFPYTHHIESGVYLERI